MKFFAFILTIGGLCFGSTYGQVIPLLDAGTHTRIEGLLPTSDNSRLISIGEEETIKIIDANTAEILQVFTTRSLDQKSFNRISAAALAPDDNTLAVAGNFGGDKSEIWIIDLKKQKVSHQFQAHPDGVRGLTFSNDGRLLASGGKDNLIKLWKTGTWEMASSLEGHKGFIFELYFSPDDQQLASIALDNQLFLWQRQNGQFTSSQKRLLIGHDSNPLSLDFSPDGQSMVTAGLDGKVLLWEKSGQLIRQLYQSPNYFSFQNSTGAAIFSPDGKYVLFKEDLNKLDGYHFLIHIIQVQTNLLFRTFEGHKDLILRTAYLSPNLVASAAGGNGGTLLWDPTSGEVKKSWQNAGTSIFNIAFGDQLELGFNQNLQDKAAPFGYQFNWEKLVLTKGVFPKPGFQKPTQNHSGKELQLLSKSNVIGVLGGQNITLDPYQEGRIQQVGFSKEGDIIATCDYMMQVYDQDSQPKYSFTGFSGELRTSSLSSNGYYLAASGSDGVIRLWDFYKNQLLASLFVDQSGDWVCFLPTGFYSASENGHQYLRIYEEDLASKRLRELDADEKRRLYFKPQVVKKAISTRNLGDGDLLGNQPPQANFPVPIPEVSLAKQLNLRGEITNAEKVKAVTFYVNEKEYHFDAAFSSGQSNILLNERLILSPGQNTIRLTATGNDHKILFEKNWVVSYKPTVELLVSPGHAAYINEVKFSPDGKLYATSSNDMSVKLWDANAGKLVANFDNSFLSGGAGVTGLAFSKDNQFLAAIVNTNSIVIYNLKTFELEQIIKDPEILVFNENNLNPNQLISQVSGISKIRFSNDRKYLIFNDPTGYIKFWDLTFNQLHKKIATHNGRIYDFILTDDEQQMVSIGADKQLVVWDLENEKVKFNQRITFPKVNEALGQIAEKFFLKLLTGSEKIICASRISPVCHIYDLRNGQLQQQFQLTKRANYIMDVSLSKDEKHLAVGSTIEPLKLFETQNFTLVDTLKELESEQVTTMDFHPLSNLLVSGHDENIDRKTGYEVKLWDVSSKQPILLQTGTNIEQLRNLAITDNGKYLIGGSRNNNLQFWNTTELGDIISLEFDDICMIGTGIFDLSFHPDDQQFVSAHCNGALRAWQVNETGVSGDILFQADEAIRSVDFSDDGQYLALSSSDRTVRIFDFQKRTIIQTLKGHKNSVGKVRFSPDGKYLASADYYFIKIWDWKKGQLIRNIPIYFSSQLESFDQIDTANYFRPEVSVAMEELGLQYQYNFIFTPDNQSLIVGGDNAGSIIRYDLATGHPNILRDRMLSPGRFLALSISNDQKYLLAGHSQNGLIEIIELATGKLVKALKAHQKGVSDIALTQEDSILYSTSDDGIIKKWNWQTGELLLTFLAGRDGETIIFTPDNYYYCNKSSITNLAFNFENRIYAFDQFDLFFNRPDIILDRLGVEDEEYIDNLKNARERRLKRLNFNVQEEDIKFYDIPEIEILNPPVERVLDQKKLSLSIRAFSPTSPLDRINIFINEVPIFGLEGYSLKKLKTRALEQTLEIPLSAGENNIQVSVHNTDGLESLRKNIYLNSTASTKKPNLYFIGLGVSNFKDTSFNLKYTIKDNRDLIKAFKGESDLYGQVIIDTLFDQDFNRQNLDRIKTRLKTSTINDIVIIFTANHGILDDQYNYYFAEFNTDFAKPEKTAIPYPMVENLLNDIPARKKLFFIDACHSGEIDKEDVETVNVQPQPEVDITFRSSGKTYSFKDDKRRNSFEIMKNLFPDLRKGTGAQVISSASGLEFAIEGEKWQNGVFTYCLIKGLQEKQADFDQNGQISVSELQRYIIQEVPRLTNGQQRPTMRTETIANDWQVW